MGHTSERQRTPFRHVSTTDTAVGAHASTAGHGGRGFRRVVSAFPQTGLIYFVRLILDGANIFPNGHAPRGVFFPGIL